MPYLESGSSDPHFFQPLMTDYQSYREERDAYELKQLQLALKFATEPNQQLGSQIDWQVVAYAMRRHWYTMCTVDKALLVRYIVDHDAFNRLELAKVLGFDKNVTWWLYDLGHLPRETLQDYHDGKITRKEAIRLAQEHRRARVRQQATLKEPAVQVQYSSQQAQVLPDYIADRVMNPLCGIIKQSEVERKGRQQEAAGEEQEDFSAKVKKPPISMHYRPEEQCRRFRNGRANNEYNNNLPSFDDAYEAYREFLGIDKPPLMPVYKPPTDKKRIVVINDTHDPFKDEEAFAEFIRREGGNADLCILAGDGCDMWSWSRWPKGVWRCSPKEELIAHKKTLNILAESFPQTIVLPGNHTDRALKYMQGKGLPPEMLDYLNYCAPAALSPYEFLLADIPNVKLAPVKLCGDAKYTFLYQIGDLVIGHPETYSIIPNRAVSNFIQWLESFAKPMGLVDDFKVVGIGHTHQAGKTFADFGVVGFEMGCMQILPDYSADPKLRGAKRPPVIGYTVFIQEDEVTNVEESNFIPLRFGRSFIN